MIDLLPRAHCSVEIQVIIAFQRCRQKKGNRFFGFSRLNFDNQILSSEIKYLIKLSGFFQYLVGLNVCGLTSFSILSMASYVSMIIRNMSKILIFINHVRVALCNSDWLQWDKKQIADWLKSGGNFVRQCNMMKHPGMPKQHNNNDYIAMKLNTPKSTFESSW